MISQGALDPEHVTKCSGGMKRQNGRSVGSSNPRVDFLIQIRCNQRVVQLVIDNDLMGDLMCKILCSLIKICSLVAFKKDCALEPECAHSGVSMSAVGGFDGNVFLNQV